MTLHKQESNPVILGSGELYICLASDIANPEVVTTEEEAKFINIGAIESGASIDIGNTYKEVISANRGLIAKFKIATEVRLSTGICTWKLANIGKFLTGSTFTETVSERKMIVGKDDKSPIVYLRFIHKKDDTSELTVNMYKAMFDGDLSFVFNTDNPVSINYEFIGMTNNAGNYVEFVETIPVVTP